MADLKVRKIDFQFPDDIPFQWNPGNADWGNFVNFATLIAPAFERYFIKATRLAIPQIADQAVAKDANLFCLQEAQHSKHHIAHLKMLIAKHPEIEQASQAIMQSYEDLFARESMDFHLAYAAIVELCFGPFAKFVVESKEHLFVQSDPRVASFFLWHLVEEFEHRNSAIDIYNDVVGSYWFRVKNIPKVIAHLTEVDAIVRAAFMEHIPHKEGEVAAHETNNFIGTTPKRHVLVLLYELFCSQLPYHKPNSIKQPAWATQWFQDEEAGMDMTSYYP